MNVSSVRAFRVLATDAVADAMRRRIVPVVVVVSLLSLSMVDRCSTFAPTFTRDGQVVEVPTMAGWGGLLIMVVLGFWALVLAGVLASDHLAEALDDGSATLNLARPVSRDSFVLARLAGALVIAVATAALLLLATALLMHARHGLPLGAALGCLLACALGAACVGSRLNDEDVLAAHVLVYLDKNLQIRKATHARLGQWQVKKCRNSLGQWPIAVAGQDFHDFSKPALASLSVPMPLPGT